MLPIIRFCSELIFAYSTLHWWPVFSALYFTYRVSHKKLPFVPLLVVQRVVFCGTPCTLWLYFKMCEKDLQKIKIYHKALYNFILLKFSSKDFMIYKFFILVLVKLLCNLTKCITKLLSVKGNFLFRIPKCMFMYF